MHNVTTVVVSMALAQTQTSATGATGAAAAPAGGAIEVAGVPGGGATTATPSTGAATTGAPGGTVGAGPVPAPAQPGSILGSMMPLLLIFGVFALMIWMQTRGQRAEQKKLDQMRKDLSRNDQVQTSGGILGTVVEVGDQDVLVRVDEQTNTKIRFAKAAIVHVKPKAGSAATTAEAKPGATVKA